MVEFSASVIYDAVLHLAAFMLTTCIIYLLLRHLTRERFDLRFLKVLSILGMVYVVKGCLPLYPFVSFWPVAMIVIFLMTLVALLGWVDIKPRQSLVMSAAIVLFSFGGSASAAAVFSKLFDHGISFSRYIGLDMRRESEAGDGGELNPQDAAIVEAALVKVLPRTNRFNLFDSDIGSFQRILAYRREKWAPPIDVDLTEGRQQMAVALAETGVATRRRLLAALPKGNRYRIMLTASVIHGIQEAAPPQQLAMDAVPDLLERLASVFESYTFTPHQEELLFRVLELVYLDGVRDAVVCIETAALEGRCQPEFIGTLTAALVQSEANIPLDILLQDSLTRSMLNPSSLKSLASNHWKSLGMNPDAAWAAAVAKPVKEKAAVTAAEEAPRVKPNPYVRVTTPMGVVLVPNQGNVIDEWIAAANQLKVKGFVSLDGEVAVLSTSGEVVLPGQDWSVVLKDYTYAFMIDRVEEGRVSMQAISREFCP